MDPEKIKRINALSKKQRTVGLSEEERAEQFTLRQEYLALIRKNVRMTLENVEWVDSSEKGEKTGQ